MNRETKTFALTLDMVRTIHSHPFEVVDGDTGNVLEVRLENDGVPVDLTGRYVCMVFRSCIGTALQDADSGIRPGAETGTFTIGLLPGSYGPGNVSADVQVYSGPDRGTLITSTRFTFRCRNALLNGETMRAQATYPPLVAATREANAAAAAAGAAAAAAETAAQAANAAAAAVEAPVVEIGAVTTGAAGTEAAVENVGTGQRAVLRFTIPQGRQGQQGEPGAAGPMGPAGPKGDPGGFEPHGAQHASDGADPITPAAIGAIAASGLGAAGGVASLDANGKVTAAQSEARIVFLKAGRSLTGADAGVLLLAYSADVVLTVPAGLPVGMEVEVCRWDGHTVSFAANSNVLLASVDLKRSIAHTYGCAVLKHVTQDRWLLAGDLG